MSHQSHSRQSSTATMHQLSNGLFVSGPHGQSTPSPRSSSSRPHSGPTSNSKIPPTGLITSAPAPPPPIPAVHLPVISFKRKSDGPKPPNLSPSSGPPRFRFVVPPSWAWAAAVALAVGISVGALVWVVAREFALLAALAAAVVVTAAALGFWNWGRGRWELERHLRGVEDTEIGIRDLPVGKLVKITGLVTCGAAPLETSYQNIPRCVYISTELYEYRGWKGLPVNSKHRRFTWGLRHSERQVSDFYLSDLRSGTRFLVRSGSGARVVSFVKPATVVDMTKRNRELTPNFTSWLTDRNISSTDRVLRLEEGFIKEGGIASVMGILRKHENLIIIDQPREPISTGCQWKRFFFPMYVDGLVLIGDATPESNVCHV